MIQKLRTWTHNGWLRVKRWWLAVLVALGMVAAPIVLTAPVEFTYTRADLYEDGSPLPLEQIAETRLYCKTGSNDYALVASEAGADGTFNPDLAPGNWTCVATHVASNSVESAYSNTTTRLVLPTAAPGAPVLDP